MPEHHIIFGKGERHFVEHWAAAFHRWRAALQPNGNGLLDGKQEGHQVLVWNQCAATWHDAVRLHWRACRQKPTFHQGCSWFVAIAGLVFQEVRQTIPEKIQFDVADSAQPSCCTAILFWKLLIEACSVLFNPSREADPFLVSPWSASLPRHLLFFDWRSHLFTCRQNWNLFLFTWHATQLISACSARFTGHGLGIFEFQ